ncbi:hypothetical protein Vi05172_g7770 [Venturia inaequalis]|nr:hypothetical protein Vi05172_g7770 [Venturia inaequalis]
MHPKGSGNARKCKAPTTRSNKTNSEEEDIAGGPGEEQDKDSTAGEEQAAQSKEEVTEGEESKEATSPNQGRNGSVPFRVELERAMITGR